MIFPLLKYYQLNQLEGLVQVDVLVEELRAEELVILAEFVEHQPHRVGLFVHISHDNHALQRLLEDHERLENSDSAGPRQVKFVDP